MQHKDKEFLEEEKQCLKHERTLSKHVAQFNLSAAEQRKRELAATGEFHHSYIFNRRGAEPERGLTQDEYNYYLGDQVRVKNEQRAKLRDSTDRLGKNEQRYLAAELAESRRRYLESKSLATKQYQCALYTQVKNKPFRLPKAEPDSDGPIFGRNDMTAHKVSGMRSRAKEVLNHQLATIRAKEEKSKREKNKNRRYETEVLSRTKKDLRDDTYKRFQMSNRIRRDLEASWTDQHGEKRRRDGCERKHQMTAGLLLLDQCDKYGRCGQCERCCDNIGTSSVWRESRYISGSRLMV